MLDWIGLCCWRGAHSSQATLVICWIINALTMNYSGLVLNVIVFVCCGAHIEKSGSRSTWLWCLLRISN